MGDPIVEGFMMWRCKCGKTSFRHHEYCDSCGEPQPAPPPDGAEPSGKARSDYDGPVTGGMDMGLDVARRDKSNFYKKVGNYSGQSSNDMGLDLSIRSVGGTLHVGDTVTVGDGPLAGRWVIVSQHTGDGDLEAQMQRADEPAVLTTIKCPHCGDVTEQSFMLSEFTCGSCDEPFPA